jgi:serine phosphatase RsbU (regulator of sigma subunit)
MNESIYLLGLDGDQKRLQLVLEKLGYQVVPIESLKALRESSMDPRPDLIVCCLAKNEIVDSVGFLRGEAAYVETPVVILHDSDSLRAVLADNGYSGCDFVASSAPVGLVAGRIATMLRLKKNKGGEDGASLSEINANLRDHNERMQRDLAEARSIQQSLLPADLPKDRRIDLAVSYEPLEQLGGDWYYLTQQSELQSDQQLMRVFIADVTGHGLPAAFVGSMTKLAMTASMAETPADTLSAMNRLLSPQLPDGRFVTLAHFDYDLASGKLRYASAAHTQTLFFSRASGNVERLHAEGFALGFFDDGEYAQLETQIAVGDFVLASTDGIAEAQNMSGTMYGLERIEDVLRQSPEGETSAQMLERLLRDFNSFREGRILKDDVTLIAFTRTE